MGNYWESSQNMFHGFTGVLYCLNVFSGYGVGKHTHLFGVVKACIIKFHRSILIYLWSIATNTTITEEINVSWFESTPNMAESGSMLCKLFVQKNKHSNFVHIFFYLDNKTALSSQNQWCNPYKMQKI